MNDFERKEPSFDKVVMESTKAPQPNAQPPAQRYRRRKIKKHPFLYYWLNLIFFSVTGISLLATDFLLYASSGAGNIFSAFPMMRPEVLTSLIIIAAITFAIYFCFSGFVMMMSLLSAGIMYMFSSAMFAHFANFSSAAETTGHSETYISLALAFITFVIMFFSNKKIRFFIACSAAFLFGAVMIHQNYDKPEFKIEEKTAMNSDSEKGQKIINIMMPNLPAYGYIASLEDKEAGKAYRDQLKEIMLGFYAKYGFKLYPNSYVSGSNPYINAADSLNYKVPENLLDNLQTQVMKDSYWQFKNRNIFEAYLKNSKMMDDYQVKDYKISAYQSHGINLCRKNNKDNVYRCVTKITAPATLDTPIYSVFDRAYVLMAQWIEESGWLTNGPETLYKGLKTIYDPSETPIVGMSYNGLYIVDSLQQLDIAMENIAEDRGNNAYFIYLDMPSEMFIYDDMCKLKSIGEWLPKNNKEWVGRRKVVEKRNAYFRQTMCAYGKLGQFMQNLQKAGELDNTTVIIQGLSGMDDLLGEKDATLVQNFMNGKMASVAIYSPENKKFTINRMICSIPDILNQQFNGENCEEFKGVSSSKTTKQAIRDKLNSVPYNNNVAQKSFQKYNDWSRMWNQNNFQSLAKLPTKATGLLPEEIVINKQHNVPPLEEKTIETQKIMEGQVNVAPEAQVESLSELSKEPVPLEEAKEVVAQ